MASRPDLSRTKGGNRATAFILLGPPWPPIKLNRHTCFLYNQTSPSQGRGHIFLIKLFLKLPPNKSFRRYRRKKPRWDPERGPAARGCTPRRSGRTALQRRKPGQLWSQRPHQPRPLLVMIEQHPPTQAKTRNRTIQPVSSSSPGHASCRDTGTKLFPALKSALSDPGLSHPGMPGAPGI